MVKRYVLAIHDIAFMEFDHIPGNVCTSQKLR